MISTRQNIARGGGGVEKANHFIKCNVLTFTKGNMYIWVFGQTLLKDQLAL